MRARMAAIAVLVFQHALFHALFPALAAAQSAAPPPSAPAPLPVRRVVLYKTGVGYFEHQGLVRGRQDITIRFTSGQLNDVLKSLTTIDPKGQISGISYNSVAPIDQRLGALRLPLKPTGTAFDLMATLRGARVEVTGTGLPIQGRLLGVERKVQAIGQREYEVQEFSIVTDLGAVRSFELTPAVQVRVLERDMRQEIGRYLDVIGSTREQDVRNVVISTTGAGERPLFVSYISEVPIWKSTYRLVLPASGRPFIQGWAVVDNTIGEDWSSVELSLVAGAPQSFIQQLSQPFYRERPEVPIPTDIVTQPQTHQPGFESTPTFTRHIQREGPPDALDPRLVGPGVPGGVMGGVVGGLAGGVPELPFEAMRDIQPAAQASDLGDLFEYRIKEPVTLRKNQSALVPIINAGIAAEKISLWNKGAVSGHPLRALWLTNTTSMTLDGGSVTVIDGNAFAGEGLIESLAPSAKRLFSYGEDLAVIVTGSMKGAPEQVSRVRAFDGILIRETQQRVEWSYAVRNEDVSATTVIIEHRLRPGWTLADGSSPEEVSAVTARFRLTLAGNETKALVVRESRRGEMRTQVGDVNDAVFLHMKQGGVSLDAVNAALQPVLAKRSEVAAHERRIAELTTEEAQITSDQQRLRENMKALRGSAEEKLLLQRYTNQLNEQETRLATLRQSIAATRTEVDAARADLSRLIRELKFEL
jgi:hypothetical protein